MTTRGDDDLGREAGAAPLPPAPAWRAKDYGIGPKPEWGTPEWEDWVETRAIVAGLRKAREERDRGK